MVLKKRTNLLANWRTWSVATIFMAAFVVLVPTAPAQATATGSVTVGTQYGSTLRASFRTNSDFSGYVWNSYGSSSCTASYDDIEFRQNSLGNGWSNDIATQTDYNQCDVEAADLTDQISPFGMHSCNSGCSGDVLYTWQAPTGVRARNNISSYYLT